MGILLCPLKKKCPRLRDEKGRFLPASVSRLHHLLGVAPEPMRVIRPTPRDPIYIGLRSGVIIGRI